FVAAMDRYSWQIEDSRPASSLGCQYEAILLVRCVEISQILIITYFSNVVTLRRLVIVGVIVPHSICTSWFFGNIFYRGVSLLPKKKEEAAAVVAFNEAVLIEEKFLKQKAKIT
ncbi:hypothetical protein Tco_0339054, partial [Tanacetum coccineum]